MDTTEAEAAQVVALIHEGLSQRNVARTLKLSRSGVRKVYKRYLETGEYRRRPESGRGRVTNPTDDRFIGLTSLRNRHLSAVDVQGRLQESRGVSALVDDVTSNEGQENATLSVAFEKQSDLVEALQCLEEVFL
ncbi:uncharacterized protein LOC124540375 [Vanessa cardui]|uniref:uncharacterized protein LOC124540375 n=1 Tax=Vanessa cardui TaxID=171605 RepID=UPI001F12CE77|nr:uncharacterized protein LOC124540375 [Vanessa cardui]